MLSSSEIERLTVDASLNRGPSVPGGEAAAFYDRLKAGIERMPEGGYVSPNWEPPDPDPPAEKKS